MRSVCFVLLLGCGASVHGEGADAPAALLPFRDQWRLEADLPFPYGSPEAPGITRIDIGGLSYEDNFASRGDVIVSFTGPPDHITVEMRRFTMAQNEAQALEQFEKLSLWAYDVDGATPAKPGEIPFGHDCADDVWHDRCTIRVYFDGLVQLSRTGADLRVTLPADYRHEIGVIASDNDMDENYIDRGNVCIEDLNASAEVSLHSGIALVTFAADASPTPQCPSALQQACVAGGWAPDCDCDVFGRLAVTTDMTGAADVTVDVPPTLWSFAALENLGEDQDPLGEHCDAAITVPTAALPPPDPDLPWRTYAEIADPGALAPPEGGFDIEVISSACDRVARTEDPADFVGPDEGEHQHGTERGNLLLCSGCLVGLDPCDRLDELAMAGGAPPG